MNGRPPNGMEVGAWDPLDLAEVAFVPRDKVAARAVPCIASTVAAGRFDLEKRIVR